MSISTRRAVFVLTLSVVAMGLVIPIAFWLLSLAVDRAFGWNPVVTRQVANVLAATSFLVGVFWITWSYSYLVFVGKGMPFEVFGYALHPTRTLVTSGPYAYVRNPALIGMLFLLLGVAFLARSLAGIVLVPIVAGFAVVYLAQFEEKALARRFGDEYDEYRRNVPLLIPRLKPYIHEPAAAG